MQKADTQLNKLTAEATALKANLEAVNKSAAALGHGSLKGRLSAETGAINVLPFLCVQENPAGEEG